MSVLVACDQCGRQYSAAEGLLGKRVPCAQCGATILVQANITPVAAPGAGADTPTKPSGEDPGFDQLDSDELNKKKKHLKKGWLQIRHVESAGLLRMTVDFWLIRAGFLKAFGKKAGDKMFRDWVKKNHLQVTKPYGKRRKR